LYRPSIKSKFSGGISSGKRGKRPAGRGIKAALWAAAVIVVCAVCGVAEGADLFRVERQGDAYIGCEVLLSLAGKETAMPGVVYEWSFKGNAQAILLRKGGLECRFTPYDTKPISASASAIGADGTVLASAELTLTAKMFSADIIRVEEEKPFMLWDSAAKKDAAAPGIVAGEPVRFRLQLTPEYKKRLRIRWDTDASTGIVQGRDGPQVTIVRNEVGDAEIFVVAADENGLVLGRGSAVVSVPVSRSKVDESNRRRKAWTQWTAALSQWEEKNFDEAAENAKAAAQIDPEDPTLMDGVKIMLANYARTQKARRFAAEAEDLRSAKNAKNILDALKLYRRSYAAWPTEEAQKSIAALEAEITAMRARDQEIEWLRDVATSYDQESLFADALGFYRKILALVSDDAVAQRIDRIEKRLVSIERAKTLIREGRELEAEDRLQDALDKYKESLKLEANAEMNNHARELEGTIKERKARAASLRREGADLQKKKDNAQALLRYLESQALWPDAETDGRIAALKTIVGDLSSEDIRSAADFGIGTRADAERLRRRGHDLYSDGKYRDALAFYHKSYAISEDKQLKDWIERVEIPLKEYEAVQEANALIKEGNALYNGGRFSEALAKYKASLLAHPNAEVENFVKKLEEAIKKPTL
jgi:tetratricopeptide (TPR) repeat protein